jgi:hypothetical protein
MPLSSFVLSVVPRYAYVVHTESPSYFHLGTFEPSVINRRMIRYSSRQRGVCSSPASQKDFVKGHLA